MPQWVSHPDESIETINPSPRSLMNRLTPGASGLFSPASTGHSQLPLIDIPPMARVRPTALAGNHSRSDPIAVISSSIRWIVDAMVNSLTGSAKLAATDHQPFGTDREVAADRCSRPSARR